MTDSLIKNLRDLAAFAHADLSVADEAADEIERLRKILNEQSDAHVEHVKGLNEQNTIREDVYKKQIERLREALRKCLSLLSRAHDRIHVLPRTTDGELAKDIDVMLGSIRAALRKEKQ